jgi:aminopeptidase-like protein
MNKRSKQLSRRNEQADHSACCLKMEVVRSSKMSVNFSRSARRHMPEDKSLHRFTLRTISCLKENIPVISCYYKEQLLMQCRHEGFLGEII